MGGRIASPLLEVAAGGATMFEPILLGGRSMGLSIDESTLSFHTFCLSVSAALSLLISVFYTFQTSNAR